MAKCMTGKSPAVLNDLVGPHHDARMPRRIQGHESADRDVDHNQFCAACRMTHLSETGTHLIVSEGVAAA